MFRRTPPPKPAQKKREAIEITLGEMETLERVILLAANQMRVQRPDLSYIAPANDPFIATLYQRAGAATVVSPDRESTRIPLYVSEFEHLEQAVDRLVRYRGKVDEARSLLNRFNALLGRSRAITHMGGVAVFAPAIEEGKPGEASS